MDVESGWVTFRSGHDEIGGFIARPRSQGPWPGLVVGHENLGLTEYRQNETVQMAGHGMAVLVTNLYSRIGGKAPAGPFATPDERRRAAFLSMPDDRSADDFLASAAWLRDQSYVDAKAVALLGFCSGGSLAFYTVCKRPGVFRCLVSIYGNIILRGDFTEDRQPKSRLPLAPSLSCPMQGHYGAKDSEIAPAHVADLWRILAEHDKQFEFYSYAGANHIFADSSHPNHQPEATRLMWARTYRYLREQLGHPIEVS